MGRVSLPKQAEVDYAIKEHHRYLVELGVALAEENAAFDAEPPTGNEVAMVVFQSLRRLLWTRAAHESKKLWAYCKAQHDAANALEWFRKKAEELEQDALVSATRQGVTVSKPFVGLELRASNVERDFAVNIPTNQIIYADSVWKRHRDAVCEELARLQVPSAKIESLFKTYAEKTRDNRKTKRNKQRKQAKKTRD